MRDASLDSTKFILIALVIFAHALEICRDTDYLAEKVYVFIYSFHMPAFIILSGFFFNDNNKDKFWRGIINLLLTYSFFQVFLCGDPLTFSFDNGTLGTQVINGLVFNLCHFYLPAGALWYILSLVFWRFFLHLIPNKFREQNALLIIFMAIIVSILSGLVPLGRELSFQRTFAFYPFFLLGYYASHQNFYIRLRDVSMKYALWIIMLYVIIIFSIKHFPLSMLVQFFHYGELGHPAVGMGLRIASYIWMLPITIAMLRLLANLSLFYEQGKNTLFYYIYHMYAIMGMRIVLSFAGGGEIYTYSINFHPDDVYFISSGKDKSIK